jgi:predicted flap endonuclease-1-like 5' DNA nuclease
MNIPCYLWPLIAGLICAILGYLLGRMTREENNTETDRNELDALKSRNTKLESELAACTKRGAKLDADLTSCRARGTQLEADLMACRNKPTVQAPVVDAAPIVAGASLGAVADTSSYDGDAARLVFGKKIKQDDLKVVEGIGPKIEELFKNAGVKTWQALSTATFEECKKVLNDGGDRFKMHNPATWPDQAKLAAEGKFAELKNWQDELDGGK